MLVSCPGKVGLGRSVWMRIVYGSTASVRVMLRRLGVYGPGLLGMAVTRLKVASTSAAVNGEPSWNVTPRRRSNSQVRSSSRRQAVASDGTQRASSSRPTRLSKTCRAAAMFGP